MDYLAAETFPGRTAMYLEIEICLLGAKHCLKTIDPRVFVIGICAHVNVEAPVVSEEI